jgi:hypothetical protein
MATGPMRSSINRMNDKTLEEALDNFKALVERQQVVSDRP